MSTLRIIELLCLIALPLCIFSQKSSTTASEGTLLLMGGDSTNAFFISEFAGLVGGIDSHIAIIPTAMEDRYLDSENDLSRLKKPFIDAGFKSISIVHTRETKTANSDSLNAVLLSADGVWITGGRQWRLAKAYNGTKIVESLKTLLNQSKVVAGTSAGASIMGDILVRGDSNSSTVMLGDYKNGFGFIRNFAVDQHHIARNRQFDMFEIKQEQPDILGIGIDENTGIILNNNKFRVIGKSYVTIYDDQRWSEERDTLYQLQKGDKQFYTLAKGYEYDITKRQPLTKYNRTASEPDENLVNALTGTYQQKQGLAYGQDLSITVTYENNQLYFQQSWNNAKYQVDFHYLTTFFRPNSVSVYHFNRDIHGNIDAFQFFQYAYGLTDWVKK